MNSMVHDLDYYPSGKVDITLKIEKLNIEGEWEGLFLETRSRDGELEYLSLDAKKDEMKAIVDATVDFISSFLQQKPEIKHGKTFTLYRWVLRTEDEKR
jgi:hypothetical protein